MEEEKKANLSALGILTKLDKTEHELKGALTRAGFSAAASDAALEYVRSYGYLDDRKYAQKYVSYCKERKSRKKIKYELIKKGVDKSLIEEAFEQYEDYSEIELIRRGLYKKWNREEKPDAKDLQRLFASLSRQGFSNCDIWQVFKEENLT